jgi:hypothetical protein
MSREAVKRAERAEAAQHEMLRELERHQLVRHTSGPMMRLQRLYADLLLASDPVRGRPIETSTPQHPFDRPLPYVSTQSARSRLRMVDHALHRVGDTIAAFFDENERGVPDCCPACGGRVDGLGRPPNRRRQAREFLESLLQAERSEDTVRTAAQKLGIARSTLRRAADELGVIRVQLDGTSTWRLP